MSDARTMGATSPLISQAFLEHRIFTGIAHESDHFHPKKTHAKDLKKKSRNPKEA
jgi:hypothetical protein